MKENLYEKVKKYMNANGMAEPGDCIVAGVSGGADSVCMLHLLARLQKEIPFRLAVVHVNHGLRAEAGEDAVFVEKLCGQWGIPFYLREVDMAGYAATHRLSQEEAGRVLRYQAFQEVLEEIKTGDRGRIAVAHNADDRAETMLFHMFRGSGPKGLSSIRPVRESVVRPLLCADRQQIEAYLAAEGLVWREDSTNGEDAYARNKIRHHILPYAKREICGGAVSHMGELADLLAETENYLARETEKLYEIYAREDMERQTGLGRAAETTEGCGNAYGEIKIELRGFRSEDVVMQKRILLRALERMTPHRKDITARHIAGLMELTKKEGSKALSLPYGIRALKEYDTLFLRRTNKKALQGELPVICIAESALTPGAAVEFDAPGAGGFTFILWETAFLPAASFFYRKEQNIPENRYTKWFDYDKIKMPFSVRHREIGDYLTIDGEMNHKSFRRYMIENKIPVSDRDRIWLLADGSHVIWVPGGRISTYYKVTDQTKTILQIQICVEE